MCTINAVITREIRHVTLFAVKLVEHMNLIPDTSRAEVGGVMRMDNPRGWMIFYGDDASGRRQSFVSRKSSPENPGHLPDIVVILEEDIPSFRKFCRQRGVKVLVRSIR